MTIDGNEQGPRYGQGVDAIRHAAIAVATEKGLSALTLRAVAERANVSHGLVRHHFGSRDGLVSEAVTEAVRRTLYLASEPTLPLSESIDHTLGELKVQYELMLSREHGGVIRDAYARYRAEVSAWLEKEGLVPSSSIVLVVVALLDGLAIQRLALGGEVDVDAAFTAFLGLLKRGVESPAHPIE